MLYKKTDTVLPLKIRVLHVHVYIEECRDNVYKLPIFLRGGHNVIYIPFQSGGWQAKSLPVHCTHTRDYSTPLQTQAESQWPSYSMSGRWIQEKNGRKEPV